MSHAVRVHKYGGPEVLIFEDVDVGTPGPGEVLLRQHAIGVNFIDIYQRSGLYKLASFPATLGSEGAGEVVAVGPGVEALKIGDRVAYASAPRRLRRRAAGSGRQAREAAAGHRL